MTGIISHNNWNASRWPNFSAKELECKGTHELFMSADFLDKLQALRDLFGRPLKITSGYRSPEYNNQVSKTGFTGPHTTGCAVDIAVYGPLAYELLRLAFSVKAFTGIGIRQIGAHESRFLHLDTLLPGPNQPRPSLWSY